MHVHNADPAAGRVCSHLVTDEMLVAWGIITERHAKCVGMDVISRAGNAAGRRPIHSAWVTGHVRICTIDHTERPPIVPRVNHDPAWVAMVIAIPVRSSI